MVRVGLAVVVCIATLALVGGASAAGDHEPPMAEAGLDQTVDTGTTVYLDAGGSVDPDGSIVDVRWNITDPAGDPVASTCPACARTAFTPNDTGRYGATVSVTDDDGWTRNDTLYVAVEEPAGPAVRLSGPARTTQNQRTQFTISATAGDADLRRLHWRENGSTERTLDLSGAGDNVTLNRSFSETGTYQLRATVQDARGYADSSPLEVRVVSPGGGGSYDHCPGDGSPYFADGDFIGCNDGGADMIYEDRVLEANGESGLDLYSQDTGEVTQMVSEAQVDELQKSPQSALTRDVVEENYEENWVTRDSRGFDNHNPRQNSHTGSSENDRPENGSPGSDSSDDDGSTSEPPPAPPIPSVTGRLSD